MKKIIIFLVLTYCTYFIPVWSLEIFMYLENPQILLAFIIFKTNIDSQSLKKWGTLELSICNIDQSDTRF